MTKSKKDVAPLGEEIEIILDEDDILTVSEGDISDGILEDDSDTEISIVDSEDLGVTMEGYTDISDFILDVDEDVENLTWLVYGKNGTGKTTILSTTDGVLALAADEGTLSIKDKAKGKAKKIKIDIWDKIESTYWLLKNGKWDYDDKGRCTITIATKKGPFKVKAVAFDTITKLAEICLRQVVLGDKAKDSSIDIMKPTQAHWGQMAQKMKYWLNMYKALPILKIWLCQERSNTESLDNDDYTVFPDVNNALRNYIQSEADIIARTYIHRAEDGKTVEFRLMVKPHEKYITKDRSNALPGVMRNPNLDVMYKKVFGE